MSSGRNSGPAAGVERSVGRGTGGVRIGGVVSEQCVSALPSDASSSTRARSALARRARSRAAAARAAAARHLPHIPRSGSRESQLERGLWPKAVPPTGELDRLLRALTAALDEGADGVATIQTVKGRGCRLLIPVRALGEPREPGREGAPARFDSAARAELAAAQLGCRDRAARVDAPVGAPRRSGAASGERGRRFPGAAARIARCSRAAQLAVGLLGARGCPSWRPLLDGAAPLGGRRARRGSAAVRQSAAAARRGGGRAGKGVAAARRLRPASRRAAISTSRPPCSSTRTRATRRPRTPRSPASSCAKARWSAPGSKRRRRWPRISRSATRRSSPSRWRRSLSRSSSPGATRPRRARRPSARWVSTRCTSVGGGRSSGCSGRGALRDAPRGARPAASAGQFDPEVATDEGLDPLPLRPSPRSAAAAHRGRPPRAALPPGSRRPRRAAPLRAPAGRGGGRARAARRAGAGATRDDERLRCCPRRLDDARCQRGGAAPRGARGAAARAAAGRSGRAGDRRGANLRPVRRERAGAGGARRALERREAEAMLARIDPAFRPAARLGRFPQAPRRRRRPADGPGSSTASPDTRNGDRNEDRPQFLQRWCRSLACAWSLPGRPIVWPGAGALVRGGEVRAEEVADLFVDLAGGEVADPV